MYIIELIYKLLNKKDKERKLPQQEKELYDFTEKVIELLEKDVESICSK